MFALFLPKAVKEANEGWAIGAARNFLAPACIFLLLLAGGCFLTLRGDPAYVRNVDEVDMLYAGFSQLTGSPPVRVIWPGGLTRYFIVAHTFADLGFSGHGGSREAFALFLSDTFRDPRHLLRGMRIFTVVMLSFAGAVWMALMTRRFGAAAPATAVLLLAMGGELSLAYAMHGTPDGAAWSLLILSLCAAVAFSETVVGAGVAGCLLGAGLGTKLTLIPVVPMVFALVCANRDRRGARVSAFVLAAAASLIVVSPYLLTDPLRFLKTILGNTQMRPGEKGLHVVLPALGAAIPLWLVAASMCAAWIAWSRRCIAPLVGAGTSVFVMLLLASRSAMIVDRYFPPLAIVLWFFVFLMVSLCWQEWRPVVRTVLCWGAVVAGVGGMATSVGRVLLEFDAVPRMQAATRLAAMEQVEQLANGEPVFIDEDVFREPWHAGRLSRESLVAIAADLEQRTAACGTVAPMLAGFGLSEAFVGVFGHLFDENDLSVAYRFRAMSARSNGRLNAAIFNPEPSLVQNRLFRKTFVEVEEELRRKGGGWIVARTRVTPEHAGTRARPVGEGDYGYCIIRVRASESSTGGGS